MSERNFQRRVIKYLKEHGCYVLNVPGSSSIPAGTPDLIFCANGRFMALELKVAGNKPSLLQLHHVKEIDKAGGYALILYESDFDEYKRWFENVFLQQSVDV